jgi:hypothetical protein
VLQFQNRLYESQKLTLYLYINIEVFLGYGNSFSRTATLQHCNNRNSESRAIATPHFDHQVKEACLSYAERQQSSTKSTLQRCERKIIAEK